MPPWVNVGAAPGESRLRVSSLDGKNWRNRASVADRSTTSFSLTQELYCSAVDSMVLALMMSSWPQRCAQRDRPGMRDTSGVRHSVAITFSLEAQIPVLVFNTSDWLPIVWPGVARIATPGPNRT